MSGRDHGTFVCGFIPLTDCATLVAAHEFGFAAEEGVRLDLRREISWSNIRDKTAVGLFDVAHMLAPMPVAMTLGLSSFPAEIFAPFVLSVNGNMIGVSQAFARRMGRAAEVFASGPEAAAAALKGALAEGPLRFGSPWPFSMHSLLVEYWLGSCGFDLKRDIQTSIVPPPYMAGALGAGEIDMFCVGEPWGSIAVESGAGALILPTSSIWRFAPEKVLGVRGSVLRERSEDVEALVRALYRAAEWAARPERRGALVEVLSRPEYVDAPADVIERALIGEVAVDQMGATLRAPRALELFSGAATFPWRSQAQWIARQLSQSAAAKLPDGSEAAAIWRPDVYRRALEPLGASLPGASSKLEGALTAPTEVGAIGGQIVMGPDVFFDGAVFEPDAG